MCLDYFFDTLLSDLTSRFSRYIWNHWNNTGRRTTNDLKGRHYALNKAAERVHPNIFEIIITFRKKYINIEDGVKLFHGGKIVKSVYQEYIKLEKGVISDLSQM